MSKSHNPLSDESLAGQAYSRIYNLVYCNRVADGMDDAAVARIIKTARRCNPAQGITGLLMFGSGVFFQWLEGPRDNVTQLTANLKADPHREHAVKLSAAEDVQYLNAINLIAFRTYIHWSAALKDLQKSLKKCLRGTFSTPTYV